MERFATFLSNKLIVYGLNPDYKEIYKYSIECLLNTLAPFGILFVIGAITKTSITTSVWIASFLPLRHAAGGTHANSHLACFLITIGLGCLCVFLANNLNISLLPAFIILSFCITVILRCAPVIPKNHPHSETYINKAKKLSKYIVLTETITVIILYCFELYSSFNSILFAMLTVSLSTLIGYLRNND